ncbi:MAG: tRNA (guanosine(46)-N7)-methyltransferase TrmB [Betaproteobacteria bacterium]|nr:tRNA (guanosine(46)-N7)-methyltransferase TrmB [Betaproteobacteria bacterium]MDE2621774.1 tRNA (guanosine(46)-N7)-methyltransferase TrmB [Betaproteobacteria bacterium]
MRGGHATGFPDRLRHGHSQSLEPGHHHRQGPGSRDRGRRRRHSLRCRHRHGTGVCRCPHEHGHRPGAKPCPHGRSHAQGRGSRSRSFSGRAHAQKDLPGLAQFPHQRPDSLNTGLRPIRSYVLRQGRVSQAQQRALDQLWPVWGVPYAPAVRGPADWTALFGREAPLVLEIGFGMGESTVAIARQLPHINFLAIDVHMPGIGSLLKQISEAGIGNVRVMRHDAVEVLEHMIAPDTLDGVHIFFPDPWPKARHHKRRLIQLPFVSLLASRIKPGGTLHLATDWEDYAVQMLAVLESAEALQNTAESYAPRPDYRPLTKFEQRGLRLGHGVWDLVFRKIRPPLHAPATPA